MDGTTPLPSSACGTIGRSPETWIPQDGDSRNLLREAETRIPVGDPCRAEKRKRSVADVVIAGLGEAALVGEHDGLCTVA